MRRVTIASVIFLAVSVSCFAKRSAQEEYIGRYSGIAVSEMIRSGVPASITLAQGILESDSGNSALAVSANNHFGIKCHSDWSGRTYFKDDDKASECFRVYNTPEESFRDHSDFLRTRDRYSLLFNYKLTDYRAWARGLKKAGYATDPDYASKLISIIEDYGLSRFDRKAMDAGQLPAAVDTTSENTASASAVEYNEALVFSLRADTLKINGVPYMIAAKGDSYSSIAKTRKLLTSVLRRFNDAKPKEELSEGDIVFVALKPKTCFQDKYEVENDGETLRGIAQKFGVRLKTLSALNPEPGPYKVGDTVLLNAQEKLDKKK